MTGESPKRNAASLERVERVLARRQRRRALFGFGACFVAAIVAVPCLLVAANGGEALRVSVQSSGFSEPGDDERSLLHFSDGSEIALGAGALVRIESLSPRGAELVLERGTAKFDVAKRLGARWLLRAGGYQIDGSGASFDVDLDAERHSLSVDLIGGSLSVSGPAIQRALELQSGERLSIELDQPWVQVERRPLVAGCSPASSP